MKLSKKAQQKHNEESHRRQEVWNALVSNTTGKCPMCNKPLGWDKMMFQMHHKIPLSQGGKTTIDNCQLICFTCHYKRHNGKEFKVNGQ